MLRDSSRYTATLHTYVVLKVMIQVHLLDVWLVGQPLERLVGIALFLSERISELIRRGVYCSTKLHILHLKS